MGYYVSITDSTFSIPRDKEEAALDALLDSPAILYWVGTGERPTTVADLLHCFYIETFVGDDFTAITTMDTKWRQTYNILFGILAKYVDEGAYIQFSGEEPGDIWTYEVKDGILMEHRWELVRQPVGCPVDTFNIDHN